MKAFLQLCSFICILAGMLFITNIKLNEFVEGLTKLFLWKPRVTLKNRVLVQTGKKKKKWLVQIIEESRNTLELNKKEKMFPAVCAASFFLALFGVVACFLLDNYFLMPVLGVGLLTAPFLYVKLLGFHLKKQLNQELETTLSIITTSYIRTENIITAVQENIDYINPPVKQIFQEFLIEATLVNPDIKKLIKKMKVKLNNSIFQEWCDSMVSCQEDGKLKSTLLPIVKKLSHVRVVSVRLDGLLYDPVNETIMMVLLVVLNIPLIYFLNKEWFNILIHNAFGKAAIAVDALAIFLAIFGVVKITRPIEYKR